MKEKLLTQSEYARAAGVSRQLVLQWILAGRLKFVRVSREVVMIPAGEVPAGPRKVGRKPRG